MASATDTARFFVEQTLSELRELERQGLFSAEEISAIARKRSEYEHKVHGSGTKAADFARYVEFEMNLEFLRRKRAQRLGLKKKSHAWQRRSMSLMERATRRFPGDIALWTQYAELARKQGAFKKLSKILTSMVRLHATVPDAWIYAARYAMGELGDMTKARAYMQRGLRFCKPSQTLWLEYAKLEVSYLAKIHSRRSILGLDSASKAFETVHTEGEDEDAGSDMIALPTVTAEELKQLTGQPMTNISETARDLSQTPALSGAIPIAIFEAAMDQFKDEQLGARFFNMVVEFSDLPSTTLIAERIIDRMSAMAPDSIIKLDMTIRQPLVGVAPTSSALPRALGDALRQLEQSCATHPSAELIISSLQWIIHYLEADLDTDIRKVLSITSERLLARLCRLLEHTSAKHEKDLAAVLNRLLGQGLEGAVSEVATHAIKTGASEAAMLRLAKASSEN